ncbi:MAG TPA: translocation/assembly module TamB domain-containing protein [Pseudomonas sp.]|uniref:translocation/assembly module TamB domain-containing protein n=1 Tax=Pseudomonas sp. TaxID=306 RepID=UPI002BEC29FA|nr:translocation/assembly module TamB domain-containing protein [Pseudomonas sp.]HTO20569.1 translocation/assembly module TamB domain-containing protein [Pseudomonas sp.]
MRVVKWSLLALLVLCLVAVTAAAVALGTGAGSRWLLGHVPGLQVQGFEGRLAGDWRADRLEWQQDERRVTLVAPQLDWSARCLFQLRLCIKRLEAQDVQLVFPPSAEAPLREAQAIQLPALDLPLRIELRQAAIGSLSLNGSELLHDLQLNAYWNDQGLRIETLRVEQGDSLRLVASGQLKPSGQWPLQLNGDLILPAPDERPWALALRAEGELQRTLHLVIDSGGYLAGRVEGEVQPLQPNLPASLLLSATGFKASGALPDTLTLNHLRLQAEGDLQAGYRISGGAQLAAEERPIAVALQGRVTAAEAQIEQLRLDAGSAQSVQLNGTLGWREALSAEAQLQWRDFPWLRLYPMEPPPVTLRRLDAQISYLDGGYLGHFSGNLDGPGGPFSLSSPVSGNLGEVHLPSLRLEAGQGSAEGQLSLGFADAIRWNTRLVLSALNPAYWVADLPGNLDGTLVSQGALKDENLDAQADLQLRGELRGLPATLALDGRVEGQRWVLPQLNLQLGDNRIQGRGLLNSELAAELELALPRLDQLWPDLQGALQGRLDLSGTREQPRGVLDLAGRRLAYGDSRIATLNIQGNLVEQNQARLALVAEGLQTGDSDWGRLTLTGHGDLETQAVALQLSGDLLEAELGVAGRLEQSDAGWHWQGQLEEARLAAEEQRWQLQAPAALERFADGRLTLGPQCWRSGSASLCGEGEQRLLPEPSLRYRLRDFDLASLARWLPDDFQWQGELNGDVELDLPEGGPQGRVRLDAGRGTLRVREGGEWVDFPYQALQLDSQLRPEQVDVQARFDGGELGELRLEARIDPRGEEKPLTGTFALRGLNLAVARPFVPQVGQLEGQINGNGQLAGTLQAPQVNGQLRLSEGRVAGGELPTPLENLQILGTLSGQRLDLDGGWRSGERGEGRIAGWLSWQGAPSADIRVSGTRLPVVVPPYADLEVAPDLRIQLAGQGLSLSGRIAVPRGDITIRELPPSTVKVSPDVVIVGEEAADTGQAVPIRMDITVVVGQEELNFSGFGLTADVAGDIHIGNQLDTRGELALTRGRYRAYGQRLTIRRARLLFVGPIDQPFLDVEAIRRVDEVVAGLRITGSAAAPRVEVFSEPAMAQEQALSYLVLGRPLGSGDDGVGDGALLAQAAIGLGLAGSAGITGNIARQLGIKDFLLETEGSGAQTSVVASGRLSDRLTLSYGVGVFDSVNTLALRYRLSRRVFLEAASGLASSLDIFYRRDF